MAMQMAKPKSSEGQMKRKQNEPTPIQPTACYTRHDLARLLGVQQFAVNVAVARGELRPAKRLGMRWVFLGQWVLDWINAPSRKPEAADAQAG
jgi:hypothetical protein